MNTQFEYVPMARANPPGSPRQIPNGPQGSSGQRSGIVGWWLNLTAPPRPAVIHSIVERERLRKAELTSFSILAVFVFLVTLVSNSLADPSTGQAVGTMALGLIIAAALNRIGRTRIAAYLVPTLLMLLIMAAILQAKGGLRLIWLPAYDLFVLPIFLISLIGDRRAAWLFGAIVIGFILGDFALQPHALITTAGATNFDDIQHETGIFTWWGMVNRHVALAFFAAFFGWLGARSVDRAIARADRAEEIAELERRQLEQRRQLEMGVQQLLETHVRLANGDYSARANLMQDNQLWQVGASLNNLIVRLQRAGQAEYLYRRTEEESRRLVQAIDQARSGRHPFWPAPSGTPIDLIIERISGRERQPLPPGYTGPEQQISGPTSWGTGRQPTPYAPTNDAPSQFSRMPPMPEMPNMPGNLPGTGPLDPRLGQRGSFSDPNTRAEVPENPWFMPPEDPRS